MVEYKTHILWLEDEFFGIMGLCGCISISDKIANTYGKDMKIFECKLYTEELPKDSAEKIVYDVIENAGTEPAIVHLTTAQLGRIYLEKYIPAAIISDSSFPLNGKRIVEWLKTHGLKQYPLIGFSGRNFHELDPVMQEFFGSTCARYYRKLSTATADIIDAVVFSKKYVEEIIVPDLK
ncbi:MAG: hypothetical protein V1870_03600 [Candidatus Aenigmatarchaeota archaeon]